MPYENEIKNLYKVILKLETEEDCDALFADLCTKNELFAMAQRVKAATLLKQKKTYEQIIGETDISSATLSRVSKCLKYGEGYKKFIDED
ncbi:MAG: hypothetical protein IJ800_04505 [Clostridia bacterium]|nr:hypothetical protein [Clostridia bacterium]